MIIWGSRGREIEKQSGQFYCPQCDSEQNFKLFRVATYFTLYFIPICETQHHGDYVKCLGCGGQFKTEVLDHRPPTKAERALYAIRADLENGTPVEMARTKMVNAGIADAEASKYVAAAAGENLRTCERCTLSFVDNVDRCSICGEPLSNSIPA